MIAYNDYTDYIDLNERSRAKAAAGRNEKFRLSAPKYARAYREAFIYDIINYVDQNCIPDDAIGVEGYVQPKLTFEEKRRLRNRIVTKLYERGNDNPEALYDASAIADIFFNETDYGKKHSSYKTEWEKNGKLFKEHEQNIREWTLEQDGEPEKCLISPYDPYFSSSGLCTGRRESEYGDQIGYIIEADIPEEDEEDDSAASFRCLNESGYIQSVYVGDHNMIADAGKAGEIAENNTSAKGLNQSRYIEDRYDRAGYGIFRRFINSKTDDDNIRKFIDEKFSDDYSISPDESDFIRLLVNDLDNRGFNFNVVARDEELVLDLPDDKVRIRLLCPDTMKMGGRKKDAGEHSYDESIMQGRITDYGDGNGRYYYIGKAGTISKNENIADYVTPMDRLNMIRYFLGDSVRVSHFNKRPPEPGQLDRRPYIGEPVFIDKEFNKASADDKYDSGVQSCVSRGRTEKEFSENEKNDISVVVSVKRGKLGQPVFLAMNSKKPYYSRYGEDELIESFDFSDSGIDDIASKPGHALKRLLNSRNTPKDYLMEVDGHKVPDVEAIAEAIKEDDGKREYFKALCAYSQVSKWLTSARKNFEKDVNINRIRDAVKNDVRLSELLDDRRDVDDLKRLYYNVFSGNYEQLNYDLPEKDRLAAGADEKAVIEAVGKHLKMYMENYFGTMPKFDSANKKDAASGLQTGHVAEYNTVDYNDANVNFDKYLRFMMQAMGPYYDSAMLGDDYMSRNIKEAMVSYGEKPDIIKPVRLFPGLVTVAGGHTAFSPEKFRALAKDKPVTADMFLHTAKSLVESGVYPASIKMSVDGNGIIHYSGIMRRPEGRTTREFYDEKKYNAALNAVESGNGTKEDYALLRRFDTVDGYIGQIFEPDEYGAIHLDYKDGKGDVIIPGYRAYLKTINPERPESRIERLRIYNWEHEMKRAISKEIRKSVMNASRETAFQLKTTALNRVYKKTYDESFTKEDYEARLPKDKNHPTPEEKVFLDVIETLRGRCRFDNEYKEGATTKVASALMNPTNEDSRKQDFFISDNKLDGANMRVLDSGFDGVFCPVATGNATNQGIVRYLSRGMLDRIDNRTGKVTPLEYDKEPPVCPLIENEIFRYSFFDKWDRIQMSFSNSLTALHIADEAGVGFFNCGGYTFDDGFVVSKKFCEKYPINDQSRDDGSLRPLMAQDKLCDMHGNKGVIAKVFDPVFYSANIKAGMKSTLEGDTAVFDYNGKQYRFDNWKEALLNFKASCVPALPDNFTNRDVIIRMIQAEEGYKGADDEILRLFAENPGMDIVASPYSALSRWNGGIARESLSNNEDLNFKGGVIEGGIGKMNMIVVDMPADVKSHWPSDGTMGHADGAGRKASGQFLWALGSKSCNNIINEIYGNNGFALTNLREYLIALGLDIEEDTSLRVGYHRQVNRNEKRKLYKLPLDNKAYFKQVKLRETVKDEEKKAFNGLENTKLISAEFQKMIAQGGGFLEIPFKLEYSTFRKARINSNTFAKLNKEHGYSSFAETGHSYTDPSGVKHPTYAMPIMSKAVREGFSAVDGSKKPHEYTSAYTKIYLDSIKYIAIERAVCKLKKNKKMSEEQQQAVAKLEEKMRKLEKDAQKQYDDVVSSIIEDKIDTKENLIGKGCMTARIPNAATAVWSADPNLNINEVAMSLEHAKSLMLCDKDGNLKKDASVLLWRDPCLHDANVRYMKVVINNNLLGVAVNPLVDKPFAGDFDGDCVALAALHSYEAKMEAKKKLSMETNLLNFSDYDNDKDEYRLFFASDMDVASNWYANPALKEQYEKLQTEINVLEKKVMAYEKGNKKALDDVTFSTKKATFTGMDAVTRLRQKYANNISRVLKESLAGIGNDMLSFGDKESLLKSYDKIARVTKAKGNWKKMDSLAENIGVSYERVDDDTHEIKYDTVKDITDKEGNACTKARAEGYEREWNNETQMIAAYKADDTSTGGMHAKLLVAAFRDIDLKACLELAEPITQGILDSKHFKDDAIARDIIANFWGKDVLKGYKLTGDWSNSKGLSPDDFKNELRNTAHERIKARVKDPNVKGRGVKYIIKTDKDGDPITDRYGNKIYEETYVKCTKKEWIAQMAGMYCALDVPINEEYIKRLADIMTRTEDVPVKSVNGGFVLAKSKDARGNDTVEVVEDGAGTVCGYYDMANEEGAFSDKVNYYENKLRSYAEGALMNEDSYRFADSQNFAVNAAKLNAYDRSKLKIFDVMDAAQKALDYDNALAGLSESEILTDEEKKAAFGRKLEIREAISNSSAYAPDILIDGLKGDLYREQVKSETDILPEKSRNVKVTKENKVVCIDVNVKPLSRSDCLLTNEYEEGVSYMGETEEEYEERMSHEREAMEEISEYEMAAGAELPLSEGNAFDIEDEDDDPDGPKGPGGSGK